MVSEMLSKLNKQNKHQLIKYSEWFVEAMVGRLSKNVCITKQKRFLLKDWLGA